MSEINRLMEFLNTPVYLLLALAFGGVYFFFMFSVKYRSLGFGLLIFFSTCAPNLDYFDNWIQPPPPLDDLVLYGRSITASLLMLGWVAILIAPGSLPGTRIPSTALVLLALQFAMCFRQATGGAYVEASTRAIIFLSVFSLLAILVFRRLQSAGGPQSLCRFVAIGFVLYVTVSLGYMIMDYHQGVENGRWFGITGNPNHNAMVIALMLPAVIGLLISGAETKAWKLIYLITIGFSMIPLLLSGSRGGALTAIIGVIMLFRLKIGKLFIVLIPIAISIFFVLEYFGAGNEDTLNRFRFGGNNTRHYVWANMIEEWLKNPIFGTAGSFGVAENAYLGVLQRLGIVGMLLQLIVLGVVFKAVAFGLRHRKHMRQDGVYFDVSLAGLSAIAANSMFEATFFSNLNQSIFLLYTYLILLAATTYGTHSTSHQADPQFAKSQPSIVTH